MPSLTPPRHIPTLRTGRLESTVNRSLPIALCFSQLGRERPLVGVSWCSRCEPLPTLTPARCSMLLQPPQSQTQVIASKLDGVRVPLHNRPTKIPGACVAQSYHREHTRKFPHPADAALAESSLSRGLFQR